MFGSEQAFALRSQNVETVTANGVRENTKMPRSALMIALPLIVTAVADGQPAAPPRVVQPHSPQRNAAKRPAAPTHANSYLNQVRLSLIKQTEFAAYEHNGEALWKDVRQTVNSFLHSEWQNGHLKGSRSQTAYYVRCDRSTMTQSDIDAGRLIVVAGVAIASPGKFVVLRITQWTVDHHSQ